MKSDSDGVPADGNGAARAGRDDATPADDARGRDAGASGLGRLAGDELEPAAVGARVPAGSARAAARASAARAGITAGKGRSTPSRDQGPSRGNIVARIMRYLREVVAEMRKVIWPTRKEMITYSIVVILFLVFMIAMTWGLDVGFARAVLAIFG